MTGRGATWTEALAGGGVDQLSPSVIAGDAVLGDEMARLLCVVADPTSPYPRARHGELGIDEAMTIAGAVRQIVFDWERLPSGGQTPVVAVVDVPGQAYGRLEETLGLHLALAAAVDSYTAARRAGHPVIALVVGSAISGAFLAHGFMASQIVALDAPGVEVQAMNRRTAARITGRSVDELVRLGRELAPLSYEVGDWATLGSCDELIGVVDADAPGGDDIDLVRDALVSAVARARRGPVDLARRLESKGDASRKAAIRARAVIRAQWT